MEIKILASAISGREHWESTYPHITDEDLTPEGMMVWKVIRDYYERDKAASNVDFELLSKRVLRKVKDNPKHTELLQVYLQRITMVDVSSHNVVAEVLANKKDVMRIHLADALVAGNDHRITELMDKMMQLESAVDLDLGVDEVFSGVDISELVKDASEDNLIRVAPRSLNNEIGGGALRGHHILLAAMPETGKSLFALSMTNGFVGQGLKVLYIGNEDPMVAIVMRFVSCLTGMTKAQIMEDPDRAMSLAQKRGYDKATFVGLSPGSLPEIRSLINKHRPDVLIVDQLRNVAAKSENRTNQLEAVARGMRDFARQYNLLAISVTQAADTARNRLILDMGDIDGSNIGMPGACDIMIMVGMDTEYYKNDERHITLAKNKLTGSHRSWPVRIDKYTSRILDPTELGKPQVKERIDE